MKLFNILITIVLLNSCSSSIINPPISSQIINNIDSGIYIVNRIKKDLSLINKHLNRLIELSFQSSNGIYTEEDRQSLNIKYVDRLYEISQIIKVSNYNHLSLLNSNNNTWQSYIKIIFDEQSEPMNIPLPKFDITFFNLYLQESGLHDSYGILTGQMANKSFEKLKIISNKISVLQSEYDLWIYRLNNAKKIKMDISNHIKIKIVNEIELKICIMSIKAAQNIWNETDREIQQNQYKILYEELTWITNRYKINSGIKKAISQNDNLLNLNSSEILKNKLIKMMK